MKDDKLIIDLSGGKSNSDVINDLYKILDDAGASQSIQKAVISELIQYVVERDFSVWHHAYRLGKADGSRHVVRVQKLPATT